jgi:hypothetical protein
MNYKVKWRAAGEEPLQPQVLENVEAAKRRVRELLAAHSQRVTIDVWNEDETWQIVTPAGLADWLKTD